MSDFRIALPRAINLGPHKKVAMADLRTLAAELGFADVRTILNSGNVVFTSGLSAGKLESLLETEAASRIGLDTEWFVRSGADWKKIVASNPFKAFAKRDPAHLMVHLCKSTPALKITGQGREQVKAKGREIYVTYPDSIGTSKLKLGVVSTARNWNTVLKIAALAD
jgi:uncharacterized protein (DUF1697 family)